MQDKIKEIQDYFKNKIIAWDFEHIKNDFEYNISIKIDSKYFITFWCSEFNFWQDSDFWNKNFMDLEISKDELEKIENMFKEKWILQTKINEIKEKDLKEFERLKKLYKLI